jgi:hypothetical protein
VLRPPPGGGFDPSFGRKLFWLAHACISMPSTERWSFDESFATQPRPALRKKRLDHFMFQQSVAVLGKYRVIPHPIFHSQTYKQAKQQVIAYLPHQLPLAANR